MMVLRTGRVNGIAYSSGPITIFEAAKQAACAHVCEVLEAEILQANLEVDAYVHDEDGRVHRVPIIVSLEAKIDESRMEKIKL